MILIHEKANRGHSRRGWLDSHHTFSFAGFTDPTRMGFENLRVLNEDRIIPGAGFAPHRHESMDILTLVLSGALRHEDDRGNVQTIRTGDVQLMSAGEGIAHSEWNASETQPAHFLQIWMIPDHQGGMPSYAQAQLPEGPGEVLVAGGEGSGALLPLRSASLIRLARGRADETLQVGSAPATACSFRPAKPPACAGSPRARPLSSACPPAGGFTDQGAVLAPSHPIHCNQRENPCPNSTS
jgi:quercetin 2,3-dioxygenase